MNRLMFMNYTINVYVGKLNESLSTGIEPATFRLQWKHYCFT